MKKEKYYIVVIPYQDNPSMVSRVTANELRAFKDKSELIVLEDTDVLKDMNNTSFDFSRL